ncbi:hypothetical protein [Yoonia sediminilitoris]|uniref:Uncharacterized protein n=1 Tax=Yoonia sediminilitoris TaxID=1286148 RepID=A0A2T6K8F8_9RHOB|nr:hypothetical protein [Yoonia sediminilitoris]PUB11024.1 hypothetical protein C8N45_1155 [Yoonia sediminilitoris]RCW90943.1 hypothetical protein DFP92_1155 [Yoonia sediminilitoris]
MRILKSSLQILAILVLIGGAVLALNSGRSFGANAPSDSALTIGQGALDGLTFTTNLAPQGKPGAIRDAMFFRNGQFLSLECEDRCNYPASAYFSREVVDGHEFVVEAWCPTKDATMVWRGQIIDDKVSGTVTWSVRRFYWTVGTVLEFSGDLATEEEVAAWRP